MWHPTESNPPPMNQWLLVAWRSTEDATIGILEEWRKGPEWRDKRGPMIPPTWWMVIPEVTL